MDEQLYIKQLCEWVGEPFSLSLTDEEILEGYGNTLYATSLKARLELEALIATIKHEINAMLVSAK